MLLHTMTTFLSFTEALQTFGVPDTQYASARTEFDAMSSQLGINKVAKDAKEEGGLAVVRALPRERCAELFSRFVDIPALMTTTQGRLDQLRTHRRIYIEHLQKCNDEIDKLGTLMELLEEQQAAGGWKKVERKTG
jgi:hypothetical protein